MFKSGFITIVGRPNVGKSTFMNNVLGTKIAIMSPKAQTTRNKIQGIYTTDNEQYIFIDTPGIHKPKHELGKIMTSTALNSCKDVDVVFFIVSANDKKGPGDLFIIEELKKIKSPVFLLVNKVDLVKKDDLILTIDSYQSEMEFAEIFPISALNGENVPSLLNKVSDYLDEGPMYFPKDQIVDQPERFIISEIIREKILFLTEQEIPHSIAVIIESLKQDEKNPNLINCHATIYVERTSQKGIVIGKGGALLKEVGIQARKEIKNILGSKVYLELWVKVKKDWRNKMTDLKSLGYNVDKY